jgi:hypothetical protein
MTTLFDIVTVLTFLALVLAFFLWTERDTRTLMHFMVSGIVLAVANQIGNAGSLVFGFILIAAAIGYAIMIGWRSASCALFSFFSRASRDFGRFLVLPL